METLIVPASIRHESSICFKSYVRLLRADLFRYGRGNSFPCFVRNLLLNPGYVYSFWLRTCQYMKCHKLFRYGVYQVFAFIRIQLSILYGFQIPAQAEIGSGLYLGHCGNVVVNEGAHIGKNCNLSHEVTIGQCNRGKHAGCPTIGNNVYIGPGAKIIGHVCIGNNVAIGANCVVTHDIPDNAVVVGVPGKVISLEGSGDYICHTEYE